LQTANILRSQPRRRPNPRSSPIPPRLRGGGGVPVVGSGEGWAELDASGVRIRLVETRSPEHRAALRLQSPEVADSVGALVAAGATLVHEPTRTPQQELVGVVRDPDGHTLSVWRALTEDEYDFVPPLPKGKQCGIPTRTSSCGRSSSGARSLSLLARYRVTRLAEVLAAEATRRVSREEVIRAYILASPRVTRGRNRQPLIDHGVDVDRYRDDWEAD